ncbi:GH92 family glycosyl hydrolase [Parabacteroides bouchesdurhonensis]|uniref:GH92 family glycosyl hydrolase n=1 Tax=Parabacteroides bouchesdurhonensis TaxID=1936995 RepID=UPI000E47F5D9|nr:GH92 family glycosyl hydrolase [Parabacteroides bouchesdurhonensis]RHJ92934.1 hypothetical protein DW095_06125 [Bacteroides sp. AM07-16]
MKKGLSLSLLFAFLFVYSFIYGQNASLVNPFIGTGKSHAPTLWGNYGGTYPGAVAPWGRVQLTPETSERPSEAGYYYEDDKIRFFSCARHHSGYPSGSAGVIHLAFFPQRMERIPDEYDGRVFSHQQEQATPGYYSVCFEAGDRVEVTARERTGLFRYHSEEGWTTLVLCRAGALSIEDKNTLNAEYMHSVIRFNQPWENCILRNDTAYITFRKEQTKNGLLVKLGTSSHSFDGSMRNMNVEMPGWDFDIVRQTVYNHWNEELDCVHIESVDEVNKEKFYTALYHSFLLPWIVSDVDGKYEDGQVEEGNVYGGFSAWDTFRTLHPLLSLLKPDRQKDMLRSAMNEYRCRGAFPKGPMTGLHMIPVLVDAYVKGATDENADDLYKAMLSCYQEPDKLSTLDEYTQAGYLDASRKQSVSVTTEYAYDDWGLGQFARLTGRTQEAEKLLARSYNYRNLFDEQTLFILPKDSNGFFRNSGELGYQESNKWTASFFVPHNVQDLINLSGGNDVFVSHLQDGYDKGEIIHDNEPVFHYPYLFTWAGRPDLTSQTVNKILNEDYSSRPGGIPGNDDLGSMSSWFVLSSIGLFPACPGTGEYVLTPPLFNKIELSLQNGEKLSLSRVGNWSEKVFPSIVFNGDRYMKMYIRHQDIVEGGKLVYDYDAPVADFSSYTKPFSETKNEPDFDVEFSSIMDKTMYPDQINRMIFNVRNTGSTGTFVACLYDDSSLIASKHVLVKQGQAIQDTLSFTLYKEGKHSIALEKNKFIVLVKDSTKRKQPVVCTHIAAPSLIPVNDTVFWQLTYKNISGRLYKGRVPVRINEELITQHQILLEPGEQISIVLPFTTSKPGFVEINVLGQTKQIKVYEHALEACLLYLDYIRRDSAFVYDLSGFDNHGQLGGDLSWGKQGKQGTVRTNGHTYIVFPRSESLQAVYNNQLTMATWIYPQKPPKGDADFFTKGDYTLLKMGNPRQLVFFAGGWGRGECHVTVPEDWYTSWHHIAGVCTGSSIKLYIDGQLKQEIPVEGDLSVTELPWTLGRNAEMPYSRFSDMKFGATRIYGIALSDEEIFNLFKQESGDFRE